MPKPDEPPGQANKPDKPGGGKPPKPITLDADHGAFAVQGFDVTFGRRERLQLLAATGFYRMAVAQGVSVEQVRGATQHRLKARIG